MRCSLSVLLLLSVLHSWGKSAVDHPCSFGNRVRRRVGKDVPPVRLGSTQKHHVF